MGRHLSFDAAATRLKCSRRTVHNYIKKGLLTKRFENGKVVIPADEVEQLAVSSGTDLPALNRQTFFALSAKVRKLEEIVAVLQRALDIRDTPLRPSKETGLGLLAAANKALTAPAWVDKELEMWATHFDRFDEVTWDIISEAAVSKTVYESFLALCIAQIRYVSRKKGFDTNLDLQLLHKKLEMGLKRLRESLQTWIVLQQGRTPKALLEGLDTEKGALFRRLGGQKGA